ncbi:hypothetical protein G4228_000528, partial [Cervus hanglu yarkandensis]
FLQVCAAPEDARGYDPGLGLCLCWGPHSSEMCGPLCPKRQRQVLQLSCPEGNPQISNTEDTGSQGLFLPDGPSSPRAVGHPCHLDQRQNPVPLYVVRVDEIGFLGLTRPGVELLHSLSLPFGDLGLPGQEAGKGRNAHLSSPSSLSLNSSHPGNLSSPEAGIRNPTVCLQTRDTLAFLVTREHYPEYDLGHFYNTPGQFDWGRFRALAEESQLQDQSPHLFLQQFQEPGVYVFRLNSNWHRKMVPHPNRYRQDPQATEEAQLASSPGGDRPAPGTLPASVGGSWEAKEQVDLEGFDTETFFKILLRQCLSVTTKLSQTKAEGGPPAGRSSGPPVPGRAAGGPPLESLGRPGHRYWGGAAAAR